MAGGDLIGDGLDYDDGLEYKAVTASPTVVDGDEEGVVEAIVAVTGIPDQVGDVIVPGAFARTLRERKPKGVFSHDTKRWTARTEVVEELLPGDPRLPKVTKDGKPWPKQAGALYVKARFNLNSSDGRDAYHNVKFFSETGECEWSIGYRVPKGGARHDRRTGLRHIHDLDLFEYSPVLFGANSKTMTLSVKAGVPGIADTVSDQRNVARLRRWYTRGEGAARIRWGTPGDFNRCVRLAGRHMPLEKAKGFCALRHREALGVWPGQEHKTFDGLDDDELVISALQVKADEPEDAPDGMPGDGAGGGVVIGLTLPPDTAGQLPYTGGGPLRVELVRIPGPVDEATRVEAATAAEEAATGAETLTGSIMAVDVLPDDGRLIAAVNVPGLGTLRQRIVDRLEEAGITVEPGPPFVVLGDLPAGEDPPQISEPIPVTFTSVTLAGQAGEGEEEEFPLGGAEEFDGGLESLPPTADGAGAEVGDLAAADDSGVPPVSEATTTRVERKDARLDLLRATGIPIPLSFEEIRAKVHMAAVEYFQAGGDRGWVHVEATYPDAALVCVVTPDETRRAYKVPYTITSGGGVSIGTPEEIRPPAPRPDAPAIVRAMHDAIHEAKEFTGWEEKAGRVLSGRNAERIRSAVRSLLEVLREAGIEIDFDEDGPPVDDGELPPEPSVMPDSTAPSAMPEVKTLTAEQVRAGREILAEVYRYRV